MTTILQNTFLSLVRSGVGNTSSSLQLDFIDWNAIEALAKKQGLWAVVLDGVEKNTNCTNNTNSLPLTQKLTWIGEVVQGYEQRFQLYCKAIADLAAFYNAHGFRMMVLKGYACAMNWPNPEHRPCGDIDIWLFGKQCLADGVLSHERSIKIDKSEHHHTVFTWQGFTVENHYDFLNVHHHKSNQVLEKILKQLGEDDTHYVEVYGERVYLPLPNLHALFLIRHAAAHFAATEITIRHLLDWGFFVKAHGKEVDWKWLIGVIEGFGMKEIFDIFNAICVDDLGFDLKLFPKIQYSPILKDRVLKDILEPEFSKELPKGLIRRTVYKYRRWKANEWKHELCYNESMKSAFWSGVKNHLLKPSSI